jgi:hypothetical protein
MTTSVVSWSEFLAADPEGSREVVGLERGSLSLVSTNEELLGRKSSGSGLENQEYCRRDPPRRLRDTPLSAKVGTNYADTRRSLVDSGHGV